jgi:hypothetical protein
LLLQQRQHMELHQLQQMEHLEHLEQLEFQPSQLEWPADAADTDWAGWNEWSAAWQLQAASYDWDQSAWDQSAYKSEVEAPCGDGSTNDGGVSCAETYGQSTASSSEVGMAAEAVAASTWGAFMSAIAPTWDCCGIDMGTTTVSLEAALPVPIHQGRVVPQMGIPQAAQGPHSRIDRGIVSPICLSTALDATSAGYGNDATRKVLSSKQLPLHPPPPPARPLTGSVTQIPPPPPAPPRGAFGEALGGTSSCPVAWLPLGANNELQLCVDADSSNLDSQLMQISAQLLPAFAGCDCAQLEEEDLDKCAYPNLLGTAWEDSSFRRSRVSSGQYKGTAALGTGSNGKKRRRACRVAICAAVACLHPEDFQAADAAGEHAQAFMELVAQARLALSVCGTKGSLGEDGQPWADPGNPQDCIKDPSTEPAVWSNSLKNPWQCMTTGPWGRPSDEEIFDWIYPFVDIDWSTIERLEPEVHEA